MKISLNKILNEIRKNKIEIYYNTNGHDHLFNNISRLNNSDRDKITFFHNINYIEDLKNTNAGACFIKKEYLKFLPKTCIPLVTEYPYKSFILSIKLFYPEKKSNGKISKNSIINSNSTIGNNVEIQDNVVIEKKVSIGDNCIIYSNTSICENTKILSDVSIGHNCYISNSSIGNNCKIQSGAVIGSTGFGFSIEDLNYQEFHHLGKVIIGNNVKIGSNSTIARGSIQDTVIGNNVRIDNLVHISHNVIIGNECIIAAQSGIAGSTVLGNKVIIGGQVGISGHLKIGNNVKIAAKSGVIKNIPDNTTVGGYPARNIRDWHRSTIKSYLKKK